MVSAIRILKIVILLFLLIISLSGCIANQDEGELTIIFDESTGIVKDSHDLVTYEVKQKRQNLEENPIVKYTLRNESPDEIAVSPHYFLDQYNYDKDYWDHISTFYEPPMDVPMEGEITLDPNDEIEFAFTLEVYEDDKMKKPIDLETGRYRINQFNFWNYGETNQIRMDAFIEFEIRKD